jgi:hypothetical protein
MRKVDNIYEQPGPDLPSPPRRTFLVKEGSVVEKDGQLWVLIRQYAGMGESYKVWKHYAAYEKAVR